MNNNSVPRDQNAADSLIENIIIPRTREINDFKVRRVLPSRERRMVGPFIFFDQMGPEILHAGKRLDVAPHPHIGLATVTYLFSGELVHRDGLGTIQPITAGAVNWMTAGSGIAHSERTPTENSPTESELYGIQSWVALPEQVEEVDCSFAHYTAEDLPIIEGEGKHVRLLAGSLYGKRSPVKTFSEMFYAEVSIKQRAKLSIPAGYEERAIYVLKGEIETDSSGNSFEAGKLLVLKPQVEITIVNKSADPVHLMLFGGEPFPEKRFIWWNFVSSREERIEQAKRDWAENKFAPVPEETERIPLPEPASRPAPVHYP